MRKNFILTSVSILLGAGWFITGCTTNKITSTARTAREQLLLSTATDHALQNAGLGLFAGQKVFVDVTYYDSYDAKYVQGTVRDALGRAGALLEDSPTNSDIIVEARSGALAIDDSDSLFGIPPLVVPVPLAGSLQTPEVAFYKAQRQNAVAKFALLAYARQSREHVYSSGSLDGKSYHKSYKLFFVSWIRTDLSEKKTDPEEARKYQTWFPQSDRANLPTNSAAAK